MKFVSSLFLVLLLSVSVTARKRLTRGNLRDLDEGRRLDTTKATGMSMAKGKGSKKSEAPSDAPSSTPSVSKMSKSKGSGKGSKNLAADAAGRY